MGSLQSPVSLRSARTDENLSPFTDIIKKPVSKKRCALQSLIRNANTGAGLAPCSRRSRYRSARTHENKIPASPTELKKPPDADASGGFLNYGGEAGIRTLGRFNPSPVFKTGTFGRSVTSPKFFLMLLLVQIWLKAESA